MTQGRTRGKTILLAGATGPIGRATAAQLAPGNTLLITGRNPDRLSELVADLESRGATDVVPLTIDLAETDAFQILFAQVQEHCGAVEILVNCSGGWQGHTPGDFLLKTHQELRQEIEANLVWPTLLSQGVLTGMVDRGSGRIVHVSSVAGAIGLIGHAAYSGAKAGVTGLVRQLAMEFGESGITANAVAPRPVDTPRARGLLESGNPRLEAMLTRTPDHQLAVPAEIAALIEFLVSDVAGHINGQTILIDGGMAFS